MARYSSRIFTVDDVD